MIVLSPLSLIRLSQKGEVASLYAVSALSLARSQRPIAGGTGERDGGLLIPVSFSLASLLMYSSVFQSKLLPQFISVWGLVAAVLILLSNLLAQFVVVCRWGWPRLLPCQ